MRTSRRAWPEYLEPLRPDQVARHRMQRAVLGAAEAVLRRPRITWVEVTARWSSVLAPIAAGLVVASGVLLYRLSQPGEDRLAAGPAGDGEPAELVPALAPDAEAPPSLLIDFGEPSRDAVLTAALVSR